MRNATILAFCLGLTLVGACGDDDDDEVTFDAATTTFDSATPRVDARPAVDSAASTPDAAPSVVELTAGGVFTTECAAGLGTGGTAGAFGGTSESGASVIKLGWANDAQTTQMWLEIWQEFGAPTAPGTYDITADEADYATCGLCLLVYVDDKVFMPIAGSGSITLTDYAIANPVGSDFSGSLTVNMQEVTIDAELATTPVAGGCTGALTSTWSGNVAPFSE